MATITTFDLNGSASGVDVARSYTENGAAITLAPSATLAATGNFAGQTLRLSGLLPEARIGFGSGVTISGTSVQVGGVAIGSLTGGTGGADLVFTFNTSATASRVQTLLRNLTYSDTSDQPTATQPILFDLAGTVRTDNVSVVAVNDLPVIDLNGAASGFNGSASLLENGSVAIAPAATLSDVDTSNLVSLTASLLARPDGNGVEALALNAAAAAAASAAGLSVSYAASTGILTISGAASQATYQAVLSGITYANTSENPATAARTVRVVTNDGQGTSVARDASVGIVRVNDAPVLDLNGAAAGTSADLLYSIGGAAAPITPTATVEDIDSANFSGGSLRAAFTQNGTSTDQLRIVTDGVVTLSGTTVRVNGTSVGTVSGGVDGADLVVSLNTGASPAAVQALVQHIGYLSGPGNTSLLARQVTFTANDGDGIANGGQAVGSAVATVNLTSVANAPPVMTGDLQAPIANGGTYVFTTSDFYFTDPDDAATGVTFRASQLDNGYILINGQAVSSFTAAQLAAGQVSFWHDGTEPVGSFRLTVDDGNEDNSTPTARTFVFNVGGAPANVAPVLTGDFQATVANAGSYVLTGADLSFTDPDDTAATVTFSVGSVTNGSLRIGGAAVTSFTGQQLASGQVSFLHNGAAPSASFSVSVEDGNEDNSTPVARSFVFDVGTPSTNAPPVMTGDLQAPIANGGTYVFTTSDFYFTDPDDAATGVTFRASQLDNGYILINGQAVSSFTAAQLAAGQVSFWHDGTEPVGSFRLTVDDGNEDNSTPTARTFVFNVGGAPANVAPVLTGDFQATVANAGSYVLTGADLSFTDPDDTAATVTFSVGSVTNGSLRIGGAAVTSFTGQQLASGQVSFLHNGAAPSASFSVSVEDGNEDNSTPVARSFVFDVGGGTGTGLLDLSGAGRGVSANLGAGSWHLADRVMALGDSITNGDSPPGADEHGYRGFLWNNLIRNDILIDLVGPNSNGAVPDPQHAGYPGETGDDIQALLPSLLATYNPSAILLMAGTNDVFYKSNPQVAVQAEIRGMLDHVAQNSPSTHVYVSTLLPLAGYATQVPAVNAAIRTAVNDSIALGRDVSLVEMPDIGLSDLFDGIHPTDAGYMKMAAHWTAAFLADQPDRSPPTAIAASVDSITGSVHNDLLTGDGRANALSGGSGQDRLRGEGGADMLTGGAQADTFVFGPGFGQDTITDFRPNEDQLDLRALSLTVGNFNTWLQANASTVGTATVLTIAAGDTIRLNDVTLASLHANDFLF